MTTIRVDSQNGLAYVELAGYTGERGSVKDTKTIEKNVLFDYDKDGKLIGIELLHVTVVDTGTRGRGRHGRKA
jgi:uncharacterized protein YuzE